MYSIAVYTNMDLFMPTPSSFFRGPVGLPSHGIGQSPHGWVDKGPHMQLIVPCNGYRPEAIKVEVCDKTNIVSIKGVQRREISARDKHMYSSSYSEFSTQVSLPQGVDTTQVSATVSKDGSLVICVAKAQQPPPAKRRITIK